MVKPRVSYFEDLAIGMSAAYTKTITDADIQSFSHLSGDTNPLHLDHQFAAASVFGSRIVHGMLAASLLSTVFGTKLPGPGGIYISQNLRFRAPVRPGETVVAEARVIATDAKRRRATFACSCRVGTRLVIEGEAIIQVPSRTDARRAESTPDGLAGLSLIPGSARA